MAMRKKKKRSTHHAKWRRRVIRPRKGRSANRPKLPRDAVTLTVLLRSREGQELLLEAELRALVGPTRREKGCLSYDLHRAVETPGSYLLHEVWESREAHTQHTKTPHFVRCTA